MNTAGESARVAVAWALGYRILHPKRRRPHRTPSEVGVHTWTPVDLRATDGIRLSAWLLKGQDDRLAVVGHGIGLSRSASLGQAAHLNERGYTVLMFDHRNHGLSGADFRARGMAARFTTDIESCVRWLRGNVAEPGAILIVCGYSFSTFPSVYALTRGRVEIDGVICDSGPGVTLESLFAGFMRVQPFPRIPGFRSERGRERLQSSTAAAAVQMLGADWPPTNVTSATASTPMLLLVGANDRVIQPEQVSAFASGFVRASVHVTPGGHLAGFKADRDSYLGHIDEFLEEIEQGAER